MVISSLVGGEAAEIEVANEEAIRWALLAAVLALTLLNGDDMLTGEVKEWAAKSLSRLPSACIRLVVGMLIACEDMASRRAKGTVRSRQTRNG